MPTPGYPVLKVSLEIIGIYAVGQKLQVSSKKIYIKKVVWNCPIWSTEESCDPNWVRKEHRGPP